MIHQRHPQYKWYVLAITSLASMGFGAAMTSLPPLFSEIASELNLDLVQVGVIWGMTSLAGVAAAFPSGLLGDKFGIRIVIGSGCILGAIGTGLVGISNSLATLALFVFLYGMCQRLLGSNQAKALRTWFEPRQLGLVIGVSSASFSAGGALAIMFSATVLSPALGGWRHVMFLYAAFMAILGTLWLLTIKERTFAEGSKYNVSQNKTVTRVPFRQALSTVIHTRDVWLVAVAIVFFVSCGMSVIGYMPIFLEKTGMTIAVAHRIASAATWGWLAGSFLLPSLSDRIGLRKVVYILCAFLAAVCVFLIPMLNGVPLVVIVFMFGLFGGGAVAHSSVVVTEMKEIGPTYAGTAVGVVMTGLGLGGFIGATVGGAIASINPAKPFIFWAVMAAISIIPFYLIKETGYRAKEKT